MRIRGTWNQGRKSIPLTWKSETRLKPKPATPVSPTAAAMAALLPGPSLRQKHVRLLEVVESLTAEKAALSARVKELEAGAQSSKIDDAERERIAAAEREKHEKRIADALSGMQQLEEHLAAQREAAAKLELENKDLQAELGAARAELQQLRQDSEASSTAAMAKAGEERAQLEADLRAARAEAEAARRREEEAAAASRAAAEEDRRRLTKMSEELDKLRRAHDNSAAAAEAAAAAAQGAHQSKEEMAGALAREREQLRAELEAALAALGEEKKRTVYLDKSLGAAREEWERLSVVNLTLQQEINVLQDQLRQRGGSNFAAFVDLKKRNEQLEAQIHQVQQQQQRKHGSRRSRDGDLGGGGGGGGGSGSGPAPPQRPPGYGGGSGGGIGGGIGASGGGLSQGTGGRRRGPGGGFGGGNGSSGDHGGGSGLRPGKLKHQQAAARAHAAGRMQDPAVQDDGPQRIGSFQPRQPG